MMVKPALWMSAVVTILAVDWMAANIHLRVIAPMV
jgi:hypothetical protein